MNYTGPPGIKIEVSHDVKATFEHLLCHNGVALTLDPAVAGVALPPHLRDRPHVVLRYEFEPMVPIHDLEVTDEGVRATLSFGRQPWPTFVPWISVLAMGQVRPARVETPPARPKLRAV